jgi:hypothetical protein
MNCNTFGSSLETMPKRSCLRLMASLSSSFWIRGETAAPNLQTKKFIIHASVADPKTATKAANFTKL